jgi:hypothetical protein
LVSAICSYLRNDSGKLANLSLKENELNLNDFCSIVLVMDIARHVPLYKALLLLLRSVASCRLLIPLLLPSTSASSSGGDHDSQSIYSLLKELKKYVSIYTARLASVQNRIITGISSSGAGSGNNNDESESEEGVADLSKDICSTWNLVRSVVLERLGSDELENHEEKSNSAGLVPGVLSERIASADVLEYPPSDRLYCDIMRPLQFGNEINL